MSIAPTPPPGRVKKPALELGSEYRVFGIVLGGNRPPVVTVTELRYSGNPNVPFFFSGKIGDRVNVTENRSAILVDPETLVANKPLLEAVQKLADEIRAAHEREPRLAGAVTYVGTLLSYAATIV